ncbi:hypothetical protein [Polaromonas sp.]|uniref:hypothetical protein n=1 Tax=Polaromonas sp. TaxID=1869339 RepID=UPI00272EEDF1|nr:hypothetical protein [Polaromonas sp.]
MRTNSDGPVGSVTPPAPTVFYPRNFCGNKDLELHAHHHHLSDTPTTVGLFARGAGLSFQWDMTVEGARSMADMLCKAAAEAEALDIAKQDAEAAA